MQAPPQPQAQAQAGVGFFTLPPELRFTIYEYWAAECDDIRVRAPGDLGPAVVAYHVISGVSQRIRDEYTHFLEQQTPIAPRKIFARVIDFNTSQIQAYINATLAKDPQVLFDFSSVGNAQRRRLLTFELELTDAWSRTFDFRRLRAWFRFVDQTLRKRPEQHIMLYRFRKVANRSLVEGVLGAFDGEDPDPEVALFAAMAQVWQHYESPSNYERIMMEEARVQAMRDGTEDEEWYEHDL
ncbi:hypothetical protein LTR86_009789 [Recurvomyces mirabilis]|nr:hypothetical protein LTR86_009789 [Recurvomyces mirabilis]